MNARTLALQGVTIERGGTHLLGPIDHSFRPGARHLVVGPNGAGKTLMLRAMHGLEPLRSGNVEWRGGGQSFVFSHAPVLARSALANVVYPLRLRGTPRGEAAKRAHAALARTGLGDLARRGAQALSAGERQKLAIARAIVTEPEIVFFDEPTANLDAASTRDIEALIREIVAGGTTIVMTSHDLGQIKRLAQTITLLYRGRIIAAGEADQVLAEPGSAEAAKYLSGDLLV